MQMGGNLARLQAEGHFHQPGHPCGQFQMAHIRLDGTHVERGAARLKNSVDGADLDGIAQRCACAVGLDVGNLFRRKASIGQGQTDHPLLGWAVGHSQPTAGAVLVDGRAPDEGDNVVLIGQSGREPFEHDNAAALGAHIAIRGRVKGLAAAIGGKHIAVAEHRGKIFVHNQIDATGQGQLGFAPAQALAGQMDGGQGSGAGGVNRHIWAGQAQDVGESPYGGTGRVARGHIQIEVRLTGTALGIAACATAHEYAHFAVEEADRHDICLLQRLPGGLQ